MGSVTTKHVRNTNILNRNNDEKERYNTAVLPTAVWAFAIAKMFKDDSVTDEVQDSKAAVTAVVKKEISYLVASQPSLLTVQAT